MSREHCRNLDSVGRNLMNLRMLQPEHLPLPMEAEMESIRCWEAAGADWPQAREAGGAMFPQAEVAGPAQCGADPRVEGDRNLTAPAGVGVWDWKTAWVARWAGPGKGRGQALEPAVVARRA